MNIYKKVLLYSAAIVLIFHCLNFIDGYNNNAILKFIISTVVWLSILSIIGYNWREINVLLKRESEQKKINYIPIVIILFIIQTLIFDITYIFENGYSDFIATYSLPVISKSLYINFLTALFCAPVFEEIFYRHYVTKELIGHLDKRALLIISSIIFTFSHFSLTNPDILLPILLILPAFLYGWLYIYTKISLREMIIFHFFYNLFEYLYTILIYIGLRYFDLKYDYKILISLFLLLLVFVYLNRKKIKLVYTLGSV
jgi:membrane protease YdiL (CAAX protease family)